MERFTILFKILERIIQRHLMGRKKLMQLKARLKIAEPPRDQGQQSVQWSL
jgi:hypothetical protein